MYYLTLQADLTGVTDLVPVDTPENPFYYSFEVQCTSCRETHERNVEVSRFESHKIPGSRGEANLVWRCRNCGREHSASITSSPQPYKHASPPTRQRILSIECRGLEFTTFKCEGEFDAKGLESGTKFSGIELAEAEWFDYDEKAQEEVSIREINWEIKRN